MNNNSGTGIPTSPLDMNDEDGAIMPILMIGEYLSLIEISHFPFKKEYEQLDNFYS